MYSRIRDPKQVTHLNWLEHAVDIPCIAHGLEIDMNIQQVPEPDLKSIPCLSMHQRT